MNDFVFSMMLLGALSSGGSLPFWAVSNQGGIMPERNGGLALVQAYKPFDESKTLQWQAGLSLAANYDGDFHPMVDQLYGGLRWKVLRLDVGMMYRDREFLASDPALGSLSVTEGHIIESNNARTMPGYKLVLEPWSVPFTRDHLKISGVWGDYKTIDPRYMSGALVHRLRGYITYDTGKHFFVQLGLDHYALWGGVSPSGSSMEINLDNYFRICTGRSASASGSLSDRMNVLGDHGGAEQLRLGWRDSKFDLTFQWEKPYSDKSGMRFNNIPDGVYTLHLDLKDKDRWISGALLEFHYTMWQSGTLHEKETDADGKQINWHINKNQNFFGLDNYFNNGAYRSGWTHFNRMIGGPLFYTRLSSSGQVSIANNRYKAIHLGVTGKLFKKAPYKLMLTGSQNFGTYSSPYIAPSSSGSGWNWWEPNTIDKGLNQFSAAFSGFVPLSLSRRCSLDVVYGLYADAGEVLPRAFAGVLGLRFNFK